MSRLFALAPALAFALGAGSIAQAQDAASPAPALAPAASTPAPALTGPPVPLAFTAHAHGNVSFTSPKSGTYAATARYGIAQRDRFARIDLLSVESARLPITIPKLSLVIDREARSLVVWNDQTRSYYRQSIVPRLRVSASATPRPSASSAPRGNSYATRSPLADLQVLNFSIALGEHTTTAGIATTGLNLNADVRGKTDGSTSHLVLLMQLADDFAGFPIAIDGTLTIPGAPLSATLKYGTDDFDRIMPPVSLFTVPAGYRQADSLLAVVLGFPSRSVPRRP